MNTATQNRFAGSDYIPSRDDVRLTGQLLRIWNVVSDGLWHTLDQISEVTGDPQASVSAQLRHLRKERFGAHEVEKVHMGNGLFRYRVIANKTQFVR
jgi:hypothetical protein